MFQITDDSIDSGQLVTGVKNPAVLAQAVEARRLFESAINGSLRAKATVAETMTTSDFPVLLGVAYARELQTEYAGIAPVWPKFAKRTTAPNFKKQKLVDILGGISGLEVVPESTEYPARHMSESSREFKLRKRGARIPLTWEMMLNDDLGAFRDLPGRLAISARESEGSSGPVRALCCDPSWTHLPAAAQGGLYFRRTRGCGGVVDSFPIQETRARLAVVRPCPACPRP